MARGFQTFISEPVDNRYSADIPSYQFKYIVQNHINDNYIKRNKALPKKPSELIIELTNQYPKHLLDIFDYVTLAYQKLKQSA